MEEVMIISKYDLSYEEKDQINRVINLSFDHSLEHDNLSHMEADHVCIIKVDGIIVGVAMVEEKRKNVIQVLSSEYLFIHTVAVLPDYRSRGYCNLMIKKIVTKYGREKSMYLSVETGLHTANKGAIKCYQKNGFRLVDCLYEDRQNEQVLSYMVRLRKPTKRNPTKRNPTKRNPTKRKQKRTNKKWSQLF